MFTFVSTENAEKKFPIALNMQEWYRKTTFLQTKNNYVEREARFVRNRSSQGAFLLFL